MWSDTLLIVGISVFTALLGEGFTWLLVYRTEKYTRLKQDLEKQASVYIAYIIGVNPPNGSAKCYKLTSKYLCIVVVVDLHKFLNKLVILQTRRLERKKEAVGDSALDRTQKRKLERDEERLKSTNRYLDPPTRYKSSICIEQNNLDAMYAFSHLLASGGV